MSNAIDPQEIARADTIAFHFYTKLFYVINQARATEGPSPNAKADKWFNLESPDSELLPKEARDAFKSISSLIPSPGIESFEVQVLLSVPELSNNQILVYSPPDSSRIRLEPTPRFILLESWKLDFDPSDISNSGIAAATTYKHGIVLFRSLFSLLRLLPTWKLYKRMRRKTGGVNRNGNLGIQLRVRSYSAKGDILGFGDAPCPSHGGPLPTATHSFTAIPHLAGSFSLTATYLAYPHFQLEDLESFLSSNFISLDQDFVPTLDKNRQRDSITGSSLPVGSGIRYTTTSRSPPRPIGRVLSGTDKDSIVERFILPTKVSSITAPSLGTSASTGASALIPPPRPIPSTTSASPFTPIAHTPPASALPISRIRKESFNSTSSLSMSTRDLPPQMSSVSSSPTSGGVPIIRRPTINTVHPFKSNTLSSHSGSSPSLSIRQGMLGGSPLSTGGLPSSLSGHGHSRQASLTSASPTAARFSPSPIPAGSAKPSPPTTFAPSSLGDRRPGTSGSGGSNERRQSTIAFGSGEPEEPFAPMPPRKRYSSSFSHRYVGSLGSATSVPIAGDSGVSPVDSNGRDTPASAGGRHSTGLDGRKDHHGAGSYTSNATDDDEISIFVQDIDARKPLSGRTREREERERESFNLLGPRNETRRPLGQGHDRETTDTTIRGKRGDVDPPITHHRHSSDPPRSSPLSFTRPAIDHTTYNRDASSSTSPPANSGIPAPAVSVSPTRGAMLTSRDEVDERLKMMNEKFMDSLKVLDQAGLGTTRRRDKARPHALSTMEGVIGQLQPTPSPSSSSPSSVPPSGGSSGSAYPSPYVTPGQGLPPAGEDSGSSAEMSLSPGEARGGQHIRTGLGIAMGDRVYGHGSYDIHVAGRGIGLGRGGQLSTSSTLNHSDGNSQGSEEVLGRMDLYYEERKNRLSES